MNRLLHPAVHRAPRWPVFVAIITTGILWSSCLSASAHAMSEQMWRDALPPSPEQVGPRYIVPEYYRVVSLHVEELRGYLQLAPMEGTVAVANSSFTISLPLPDGREERFAAVESPIMAPELAAQYPEIRTYLGQGIDEPRASVRFDLTPAGFHAIIFHPLGTIYIDPYAMGTDTYYISYYKRDFRNRELIAADIACPVIDDPEVVREIAEYVALGLPRMSGAELRTYRTAVAATGEYTIFHGGTVSAGLAAIVTAMNRVNGIYEREVAIRMVLVPNNNLIIYTDPNTDPYTNNSGSTMLGQNQSNLDAVIGSANYDLGHVFSTGGGGIAGLGVVCRAGLKARGVTGLPNPIGDPFYVDYVAHEIGHQFGANHTFNSSVSGCAAQRNASTAYEPGSGSTIMAYAGLCPGQNIQGFSDDYFHGASFDEIVVYSTLGLGSVCPAVTSTGNNPPVVNAGPSYTIPLNTPFILTGSATDPNNDPLIYNWEQFDLGPAGHPNSPSGNAPIFRSFRATPNPWRVFPRWSDILNNTQTLGEILPTYSRTLNFRLTARDNLAGGGGVGKATTSVSVTGSAGPFRVTSPQAGASWVVNQSHTVTWDVANTNASPVNASLVNILLSVNGGSTFPLVLALNTPNDGSETVLMPDTVAPAARIMVEAANNIFFDATRSSFVLGPVSPPLGTTPPDGALNQPTSLVVEWTSVPNATRYHLQVARTANFGLFVLVNDSTVTDTSFHVSGMLGNTQYYWRLRAGNVRGWSGWSPVRTFSTMFLAPTLVSPANNAIHQPRTVTLTWNAVTGATNYRVQVSDDSTFATTILDDPTVTSTSRQVSSLSPGTRFYWRVRAFSSTTNSPFSNVWNFTTAPIPTAVSLLLPANGSSVNPDSALFVWSASTPVIERYWFELATDSSFVGSVIDSTLTDTLKAGLTLANNQMYWWRVRAKNPAGWGPFSATSHFLSVVTAVAGEEGLPVEYVLSQNFPNPFNPATSIQYGLPERTHVKITVHNLLGQQVVTLIDRVQEAGFHEVEFEPRDLPSGVYFYQMRTENFVATRKLVYMR